LQPDANNTSNFRQLGRYINKVFDINDYSSSASV